LSDGDETKWLLPTQIPFDELKGRALEECLFWLLDGMGARDIEWRIGGKGAGAADGGRDIEARFFVPNTDGQIEARRWWIECKGRSATLEKDAVATACNNVLADKSVDCLVIATNTTFSNPTRDWVRQWQERFSTPQILLWDRASLERMLAQQPATVLRLFEGGLSSAGYLQAIRERFWNLLEYSSIERIKRIWPTRQARRSWPCD
jgi:Restriction endonuclease